jgi:hypothetical protein
MFSRHLAVVTVAFSLLSTSYSSPLAPRSSPTCTFACPSTDVSATLNIHHCASFLLCRMAGTGWSVNQLRHTREAQPLSAFIQTIPSLLAFTVLSVVFTHS